MNVASVDCSCIELSTSCSSVRGASRHFQYVKKMHVRNCCAPHGCGLHPVCIYVAAAPLWLSVYVRLHACVGPRVIGA